MIIDNRNLDRITIEELNEYGEILDLIEREYTAIKNALHFSIETAERLTISVLRMSNTGFETDQVPKTFEVDVSFERLHVLSNRRIALQDKMQITALKSLRRLHLNLQK